MKLNTITTLYKLANALLLESLFAGGETLPVDLADIMGKHKFRWDSGNYQISGINTEHHKEKPVWYERRNDPKAIYACDRKFIVLYTIAPECPFYDRIIEVYRQATASTK